MSVAADYRLQYLNELDKVRDQRASRERGRETPQYLEGGHHVYRDVTRRSRLRKPQHDWDCARD